MTFSNPLLPIGQDPYVLFHDGWYYFCHVLEPFGWSPIFITKSRTILGFRTAKRTPVWVPEKTGEASSDPWAPELHYLRGKWYIYFCAWSGIHGEVHKMYVLEGKTQDPQGEFIMKGKIDTILPWEIDATVFEDGEKLYYVWSGKDKITTNGARTAEGYTIPDDQNIYIAEMENPWTLKSDPVCISRPIHPWEMIGPQPVNEGPQILKRNGKYIIIFSASNTMTDDYCLGMLVNKTGDILTPNAWEKHPEPVFSKTEEVLAPGHASFTTSRDGKEDWMLYHSAQFRGSGLARKIHAQRFTWHNDDTPDFGKPVGFSMKIPVPSGEEEFLQKESRAEDTSWTIPFRLPLFMPIKRIVPIGVQSVLKKTGLEKRYS